jgi:hypothetical protein
MLRNSNPAETTHFSDTVLIRISKRKQTAAFFESRDETGQLLNDLIFRNRLLEQYPTVILRFRFIPFQVGLLASIFAHKLSVCDRHSHFDHHSILV